jgi:hypothetical protein
VVKVRCSGIVAVVIAGYSVAVVVMVYLTGYSRAAVVVAVVLVE